MAQEESTNPPENGTPAEPTQTAGATERPASNGLAAPEGKKKKFLIFSLANEFYGISLSSVKEVIRVPSISMLPQVPSFVKGLINLRGKIISVIDLRLRLSLAEAQINPKKTCIVIMETNGLVVGCVVDDVCEVAGFYLNEIESHLDIPAHVRHDFIFGVARNRKNELILVLDDSKVLSKDDLATIRSRLSA